MIINNFMGHLFVTLLVLTQMITAGFGLQPSTPPGGLPQNVSGPSHPPSAVPAGSPVATEQVRRSHGSASAEDPSGPLKHLQPIYSPPAVPGNALLPSTDPSPHALLLLDSTTTSPHATAEPNPSEAAVPKRSGRSKKSDLDDDDEDDADLCLPLCSRCPTTPTTTKVTPPMSTPEDALDRLQSSTPRRSKLEDALDAADTDDFQSKIHTILQTLLVAGGQEARAPPPPRPAVVKPAAIKPAAVQNNKSVITKEHVLGLLKGVLDPQLEQKKQNVVLESVAHDLKGLLRAIQKQQKYHHTAGVPVTEGKSVMNLPAGGAGARASFRQPSGHHRQHIQRAPGLPAAVMPAVPVPIPDEMEASFRATHMKAHPVPEALEHAREVLRQYATQPLPPAVKWASDLLHHYMALANNPMIQPLGHIRQRSIRAELRRQANVPLDDEDGNRN